jgi:hypothetical protein
VDSRGKEGGCCGVCVWGSRNDNNRLPLALTTVGMGSGGKKDCTCEKGDDLVSISIELLFAACVNG